MRKLALIVLSCLLLPTGCAKHYRDTAMYHSSGRAKPLVAILTVLDSSGFDKVPWSQSDELTDTLRNRATQSSRLFLLSQEGGLSLAKTLNTHHVESIPSTAFEALAPAEFVVVTELIEQEEKLRAHKKGHEAGADLNLALRVRVFDLRGKEPKIVLQEVVTENEDIGLNYLHTNYKKTPWKSPGYTNTPLGMVHNKLICETLAHIEGYIGL